MDNTDTKIWERQPNETSKAFLAFQSFIRMPVRDIEDKSNNRTLLNLTHKLGYKTRGEDKAASSIEMWSSKYGWRERAAVYDAYLARTSLAVRETSLGEFQKQVIEQSTLRIATMHRVVEQKIEKLINSDDEVDALELVRVTSAMKTLDDLSRRIGRMPTSFVAERIEEEEENEDQVFIIGADSG